MRTPHIQQALILGLILNFSRLSSADQPHDCTEPAGAPLGSNTCFTYTMFFDYGGSASFEVYGKTQVEADKNAARLCVNAQNVVKVKREEDKKIVCTKK